MTDARREMFGYLAETAGVLASVSRIELVDLLVQGERSVEELAEASHLSVANASQHLQQLRRAGIDRWYHARDPLPPVTAERQTG
jgi:DNA-binding transcriptional ArsR family regulator